MQDSGFRIFTSGTAAWYANNVFGASSRIRANGRASSTACARQGALLTRLARIFSVSIEHYGNMIFKNIGEEIGFLAIKEEQRND